jgi:heme oxygenase
MKESDKLKDKISSLIQHTNTMHDTYEKIHQITQNKYDRDEFKRTIKAVEYRISELKIQYSDAIFNEERRDGVQKIPVLRKSL